MNTILTLIFFFEDISTILTLRGTFGHDNVLLLFIQANFQAFDTVVSSSGDKKIIDKSIIHKFLKTL
jgi:hypothetical protein